MATSTVTVTITTNSQVFPAGTVEDPGFTFAIQDSSGAVLSSLTTTNLSVSFPLVPVGTGYLASCTKNGVKISAGFDVAEPAGAIEVPATMAISLG